MRAYAVVETGKPLQELEIPTPIPIGEQVLLEVTHAGVCHSDIHIWEGGYDLGSRGRLSLADRGLKLPVTMGHEIVGKVVAYGPDAKGVAKGDWRVVFPWLGCGTCERCLAEEDNMCLTSKSLGVYQSGGYATHVLVPAVRHLMAFDGIDPAVAATYACSGLTVYSAISKVMPMKPDEPIVLVGAGGLGLNAIAILKALGHRNTVVVDVSADKRAGALKAGATKAVDGSGEGVTERIVAACGGQAKAVIDLVNGTATARFAFDALTKGGKLVQVGLFGGELNLPLPLMATRALTVQGSYVGNPKELRALLKLAQTKGVDKLPVELLPLEQANAALMRLRDGKVSGRLVLTAQAA